MAVVNIPAGAVWKRRAWMPPSRNQVNESGWTGARTVLRLPGAGLWRLSAALLPITREVDAWPWKAFITALEGQANTFLMPYGCQPAIVPGASVLGSQDGPAVRKGDTQVVLHELPGAVFVLNGGRALTFTLKNGQRQMVLLTKDLVATENGRAVATFRGALRDDVANQSWVEIADPVCEMSMVSGDVGWDQDEGVYNVAFDAREAFGR